MRTRKDLDIVRVKATDLLELAKSIVDVDIAKVLLIVCNDKFCLQSRTANDCVIWTTSWKRTIKSDDCVYSFALEDFLDILELAIGDYDGLDADFVSFIFTKDKKLSRVATASDSLWFDYANKLN
jgi:hypothetical protein